MLVNEWLDIGYSKGIIDSVPSDSIVPFFICYNQWFRSRLNVLKPQSIDRIECTWRKYFDTNTFVNNPVHEIDEKCVYTFLNSLILSYGNITKKEYDRIYQIVNNVLYYAFDLDIGFCRSINWDIVKRHIAVDNLVPAVKKEYAISDFNKNKLFKAVLQDDIYPLKRSACLCILLNFYLGLRIGELAAIRWRDIDYGSKSLHVHQTETKYFSRDESGERTEVHYVVQDTTKTVYSVRHIPLIPEAMYLIGLIKQHHKVMNYESEYLAYDGAGTILSKSIERTLYKLCDLCHIDRFSSHRIRKTFASELHRANVPSKYITELMGHSDIRTTEKYYVLSYEDSLEELRQIMSCSLKVDISAVT